MFTPVSISEPEPSGKYLLNMRFYCLSHNYSLTPYLFSNFGPTKSPGTLQLLYKILKKLNVLLNFNPFF